MLTRSDEVGTVAPTTAKAQKKSDAKVSSKKNNGEVQKKKGILEILNNGFIGALVVPRCQVLSEAIDM